MSQKGFIVTWCVLRRPNEGGRGAVVGRKPRSLSIRYLSDTHRYGFSQICHLIILMHNVYVVVFFKCFVRHGFSEGGRRRPNEFGEALEDGNYASDDNE
jgi:hypothetical protein